MRLLGDVGGTNTRLACLDDRGHVRQVRRFRNERYENLAGIIREYLGSHEENDAFIDGALAIAGPSQGDSATVTNLEWSISGPALAQDTGLESIQLVNDFAANAMAIPFLNSGQLLKIGNGEVARNRPIGILGPGTGLGVSGLLPCSDKWLAISGEGGHVTLAAANAREASVIALVREELGHVSAERLICGAGLARLYDAINREQGIHADTLAPDQIVQQAMAGNTAADEALSMFFAMLGGVAGDLALTLGAGGGVYIAGGIIPRQFEQFKASHFRDRFESKGRFRSYNSRIPTFLVTEELPALIGLRALLENKAAIV